jgi:hypothetical protein
VVQEDLLDLEVLVALNYQWLLAGLYLLENLYLPVDLVVHLS